METKTTPDPREARREHIAALRAVVERTLHLPDLLERFLTVSEEPWEAIDTATMALQALDEG